MGIVLLGGASAQMTFVPKGPPSMELSRMLKLLGVTYHLHSKSVHHFDLDVAWESLIKLDNSRTSRSSLDSIEEAVISACIPIGYSKTLNLKMSSDALKKVIFVVDDVYKGKVKVHVHIHRVIFCSDQYLSYKKYHVIGVRSPNSSSKLVE